MSVSSNSVIAKTINKRIDSSHIDPQHLKNSFNFIEPIFMKAILNCLIISYVATQACPGQNRLLVEFILCQNLLHHLTTRKSVVTMYSFHFHINFHWMTPFSSQKLNNRIQINFRWNFYHKSDFSTWSQVFWKKQIANIFTSTY